MDNCGKKENRLYQILALSSMILFTAVCIFLRTDPVRLIGAAFCHQIPGRSPAFSFPFCYRCSGLFSGVLCSEIVFLLCEKQKKLLIKRSIVLFVVSLAVYFLDILNSSKFPDVRIYTETVTMRFLSSYPLGFSLGMIILQVLFYFYPVLVFGSIRSHFGKIILMIVGWIISYGCVFSGFYPLSIFLRILLGFACFVFLCSLYSILIFCIVSLKNREFRIHDVFFIGLALAFFHTALLGGLHLRFLHFELLFS